MQVFAEDGTRIHARVNERQHVDAVVLIHGFPFSASIWDAQADALARDACVVCPDLRGAGKSSESEGPYLMETLAADAVSYTHLDVYKRQAAEYPTDWNDC